MDSSSLESGYLVPNYVIVAGQGEGVDRLIAVIDNTSPNVDRCELFIDARDIKQEEGVDALIQRGNQKLSEYGSKEVYNISFSQSFIDRYRTHFDLGDIGTIKDRKISSGSMDFYLTKIEEVYEEGILTINATFGYDKTSLSDAIKRIESKTASLISAEGGGVIPIASGGTGATTAELARTNLGITPANIGASPTGHTHTADNITNFQSAIRDFLYPVGSIYMSVVSTSPASLFGGSWSAWGAGKVPVGVNTGETEFNTVEKTGGAKTHTLQTTEIPSHNHTQNAHTHTQNSHTHTQDAHTHTQDAHSHDVRVGITHSDGEVASGEYLTSVSLTAGSHRKRYICPQVSAQPAIYYATPAIAGATATNIATTATNNVTGGGGAHNNLQPYITCYMWKRTA